MITFLIRKFIKDSENTQDKKVREHYSVLGGVLGIVCNCILFLIKLFIGIAMNSIAIMSDAFNNLSDMGSCFVVIIGAKMANRLPDREHPFGHGRIEYISSLIVSFIIMIVGFELFKTSIDKIQNPELLTFNLVMVIILIASLFIKLWMYVAYNYIAKKINSSVIKATAKDSINDVISTSAVILATIIGNFIPYNIDGFIGVLVAVYIMYGGFNLAKETINLILGTPPSKELIASIKEVIENHNGIFGTHDLMVHDYGPGRVFASVHAEVPDDADFVHVHEIIDTIEREILAEMGIQMVIHMDPVSVNNERVNSFRKLVTDTIKEMDISYSIHDFRIVDGEGRINVIFDIVMEGKYSPIEREEIVEKIKSKIKIKDSRLNLVVTIDEFFA